MELAKSKLGELLVKGTHVRVAIKKHNYLVLTNDNGEDPIWIKLSKDIILKTLTKEKLPTLMVGKYQDEDSHGNLYEHYYAWEQYEDRTFMEFQF